MSVRAGIRGDFVRRLFAVAVSVGFAATLTEMEWVVKGSLPNKPESEQLFILFTGLVATVLSWDGYLVSIESKPLNGYWRFAIDILLVFIYMFFLISSKQPDFWLPILAVIFVLYVIWDFLTVREHMRSYNALSIPVGADETYKAPTCDVLRVYVGGFLGRPNVGRGPIITLSWALYFVVLAKMNLMTAEWQVLVTCIFAIMGLIFYRKDKAAGYSMWKRTLIILLLLGLAALYFYMFPVMSAPK